MSIWSHRDYPNVLLSLNRATRVQDEATVTRPVGEGIPQSRPRPGCEALVRCGSGGIFPVEGRHIVALEQNRTAVGRPLRGKAAPRIEGRQAGGPPVHVNQPEIPPGLATGGRNLPAVG